MIASIETTWLWRPLSLEKEEFVVSPALMATINRLAAQADQIFDITHNVSASFQEAFLRAQDWRVLIYERDFKDVDGMISNFCPKFGYANAMSFSFGGDGNFFATEMRLLHSELSLHHTKYFSPSYAIFEGEERFSIVSDSDYFWAIAGKRDFLIEICESKPLSVLEEFRSGIDPYIMSQNLDVQRIGRILESYHSVAVRSWSPEILF